MAIRKYFVYELQAEIKFYKRPKAIRQNNLELILSHNIVSFDVVDQLQFSGLDKIRMCLENCFSWFAEVPVGFEVAEPFLLELEDVPFCYKSWI